MKKKINICFISLAVAAIILSAVLSNIVSYTLLQKEIYSDLEACAYALAGTHSFDDPNQITYRHHSKVFRVTLIDTEGNVKYDSSVDTSQLGNHEHRSEIAEARKKGEGQSVRHSDTLEKDTFYFAILLDNGCVLRLAKEVNSIVNILLSSFSYLVGIIFVLIVLSVICSGFLAKSIISPVVEMAQNMDHLDSRKVYKELRPFVATIQEQHENIVRNADMRQEFSANVSHELKTPLTAISGYSEIMENGMATEEDMVRFAGEIHRNANRLLGLINDTIRLSELDASVSEMATEELNLYELAKSCVETLQVKADKMNVSIRLVGEACWLNVNKEMMHELLYNLCDNAIRYNNKDGSVVVIVGANEEGNKYLEVKDTGIGISREHQERVFERFYRVDKSRSKQTGGTGLGLAIVKHIVAQNRAVLQLDSELGKGTTIRVIFPLSANVIALAT